MTVNNRFEAYKIRRELQRSGKEYVFKRVPQNEFGEPTPGGDPQEVAKIKGLYHEQSSYITKTISDGEVSRKKKVPQILCLCEDLEDADIKYGDTVEVKVSGLGSHSRILQFVGMVDVQNWGIIADLSFEEVDDGS